jgi:hypothetical protein
MENNCTACVRCDNTAVTCGDCACGGAAKCFSGTLGSGDYDVTINATRISAVGSYPSRTAAGKKIRTLTMDVSTGSSFEYAVFARERVILLNNARIDSYDSALGAYGGTNVNSNANVGTNGNGSGEISLGNNAMIRGNAGTGPGGTVALSNNAAILGSVTHSINRPVPQVQVPASLTSLSSSGAMTVSGTATISGGNYKYSSITMGNNGTLNITGTVNLYLTSTATAISFANNCNVVIAPGAQFNLYVNGVVNVRNNSSINTQSHDPANFQLYSTYEGANGICISNNGNFYGAVYAPDTDIVLANNVDCFGSFVGQSVDLSNNADIHYDERLCYVPGMSTGYDISNWQDL